MFNEIDFKVIDYEYELNEIVWQLNTLVYCKANGNCYIFRGNRVFQCIGEVRQNTIIQKPRRILLLRRRQ